MFVAVTVTPGINAFVASSIVPLIVPYVDWANPSAENATNNTTVAVIRSLVLTRSHLAVELIACSLCLTMGGTVKV